MNTEERVNEKRRKILSVISKEEMFILMKTDEVLSNKIVALHQVMRTVDNSNFDRNTGAKILKGARDIIKHLKGINYEFKRPI